MPWVYPSKIVSHLFLCYTLVVADDEDDGFTRQKSKQPAVVAGGNDSDGDGSSAPSSVSSTGRRLATQTGNTSWVYPGKIASRLFSIS